MLGFLYLILILGWMLIVIFLKCKKTLSPHLTLTDNNYPEHIDRRPSVHVIQLHSDDYRDTTTSYNNNNHHHHHHRSIIDDRLDNNNYPNDSVINPAYTNDEEFMINAPPPSYEEVMRQPDVYPKVQEIIKSQYINNNNNNK